MNIKVIVTDEMKTIIKSLGNSEGNDNNYIFPIIDANMDVKKMDSKIHIRNKSINETLEVICRKLDIAPKITLSMARHTFANALKQEGVNIAFIQESLGHGSSATTEHYLNSFENTIIKFLICNSKNLMEFNSLN